MIEPRTYRPKGDGESVTAAYSLPKRVVDWIARTALAENATKSFVVSRELQRAMKATTENEPAYDERETA